MQLTFSLIALVAIAFAIACVWACIGFLCPDTGSMSAADAYEQSERARMPAEIQRAKLIISEKTIHRHGRRPFAAKTDQVFQTADGWVIPVETKTRRRILASDLVQISAQALAIAEMRQWRGKVANYGYIRLAPADGAPYYQRVLLLHPTRVDQLWDRYQGLRTDRAKPIARPDPRRCGKCPFRSNCNVRAG